MNNSKNNEKLKSRIKKKFKHFQFFKIKQFNKFNSINPENTFPKKNNKKNNNYEIHIHKKLYLQYNILPNQYEQIQINNFIKGKYCHSLSFLKESLIYNYQKEFLKKYYTKTQSMKQIKLFAEFYKTYLQFFCSPTLNELNLNELIEEMVETKAMVFYKKNYKDEKSKKNKEKKRYINMIVFTDKIKKDISRKNTLKDLSKTTIGFNSMTHNTNTNSYKSINSLINEIGENKNNDININKNIKNYYNTYSEKDINIITNKTNPLINKKIPKIKLNLNSINNKTNISRQKNNNKNSKPTYHKINIVNNKIIIINNNSKSKIKKNQKKNNLTLLSRNSFNNNYFSLFNEGVYDYIKSQDRIINSTNNNNSSSFTKTLNKERKSSSKIYSNNKINSKNKINNKIIHIKKIKEKNLILKPQNFQKIFNNNKKIYSNFSYSYLKGAKTERDNSKEKKRPLLTNFQIFNNNIKSIKKIRYRNNISRNKYSSKNIKTTNSILIKNETIKNILKISTLNTFENIRNINKMIANTSRNKNSTKKKDKTYNSKIKSNINKYKISKNFLYKKENLLLKFKNK
jgi:hypothetical protein